VQTFFKKIKFGWVYLNIVHLECTCSADRLLKMMLGWTHLNLVQL